MVRSGGLKSEHLDPGGFCRLLDRSKRNNVECLDLHVFLWIFQGTVYLKGAGWFCNS
jgi:hypothetical protein